MRGGGQVFTLDDDRGAGVAEDEVAVAVAEVHVPGADFRVDHEDGAGLAELDAVDRVLDTEGRRRAGDVHVEAETLDAECGLHLDGDGRIGALQVGTGDDHAIDIGRRLAGAGQRFFRCLDRHLAENRPLVIAALRNARNHALGVEDAGLVGDVAALDAGGLLDEGRAGFGQRLDLTGLDGRGILAVEAVHVGIEGLHQFVVGDTAGRGVKAGTADDDVVHSRSSRIGLDRTDGGTVRRLALANHDHSSASLTRLRASCCTVGRAALKAGRNPRSPPVNAAVSSAFRFVRPSLATLSRDL